MVVSGPSPNLTIEHRGEPPALDREEPNTFGEVLFPMTITDNPAPYYSVCSITDPLAVARRLARIAEYESWRACLPDTPEKNERDWTTHAATLTRSIGGSPHFIAANLDALTTLDRLPRLRALVESLHHLDMFHLRKIDDVLLALPPALDNDPAFWEVLDETLTGYLSPTRPSQLLPTPAAITRKIRGVVRMLTEGGETPPQEPAQTNPPPYRSHTHADGSVTTEVNHDPTTAAAVDQAVRNLAGERGCTLAEAFSALLLEKISVKVVLNLYRASDVPDAPGHLQPLGWLPQHCTRELAARAAQVRDMDEAAETSTEGYRPTAAIRAFIEGRDGTCRWPGCTRPAIRSQKDHRINHREGGPTTAANMICLCQHHHNRKSDNQVSYLLDPFTGDVYWLFGDGTWACDEAGGPLSPRQRRWVQTMGQRRRRRQERARRGAYSFTMGS